MKKILLLGTALIVMLLSTAQNTWAKCETIIKVPATACVGVKVELSISDYPCDCIKYSEVEWFITDPGGSTIMYTGSPLSYVFTTVGTYKVCVKWYDYCTGETGYKCYDVVVTKCCETVITVPSTMCVGDKGVLSISDDPCDCIKYADVEWFITDPGGSTIMYTGSPLSYVFSMVGTYTICVKWFDYCTGETGYKCYTVVVTICCKCDMKISENTSTTYNSSGFIEGSFYINSGSKKVIGMELSVPFWNYDFYASGCKFDCSTLTNGYSLGNIIKYSDVNGYYPTTTGCFSEWWAREVDWTFPTPQYIDQTFKYIISIPPTDCIMDYYYCVKVLLHYDDCTTCECTFCFKADKVICSCDPAGSAAGDPAAKSGTKTKTGGLNTENVKIFPNPNGGQFTVQMEKTTDTKVIAVMDMSGKIVSKSIVAGDKANLELNNVAPGTYNVVITSDGKTITKRVVITR